MRRREFIALIGGGAVAWPFGARAQPEDRVRRIGALQTLPEDDPEIVARHAAFEHELQALGWTIGRNVRIDYRSPGGDANRIRSPLHCDRGRRVWYDPLPSVRRRRGGLTTGRSIAVVNARMLHQREQLITHRAVLTAASPLDCAFLVIQEIRLTLRNASPIALKAAGCEVIRSEKRSGTTTEGRAELRTVLDFLRRLSAVHKQEQPYYFTSRISPLLG